MSFSDYINTAIGIVGIVIPIIISYFSNRKEKEQSCFYSYVTLAEEGFVRKTKIESNILFSIVFILLFVNIINNMILFLPISKDISAITFIVGELLYLLICILQRLCSYKYAFCDIEFLDKRLKACNADVSPIGSWSNAVISVMFGVTLVVLCLLDIGINGDWMLSFVYIATLIVCGLSAILKSFVSLYVKVRRWYYIDSMNIKTRTDKTIYQNICNYKLNRYSCDFVYKRDDNYIRIKVPIDEVASIEQTINIEKPFLNSYRNKMMIKKDVSTK